MLTTRKFDVNTEQVCKCFEELLGQVVQAVDEQRPLHEMERDILAGVLTIGRELTQGFLDAQGDGDVGETVITPDGRTLHRSEQLVVRPLRTIFGRHEFRQFQYAAGKGKTVELRPIDLILQLGPDSWSYLFEGISQRFCGDQAFRQAADNLQCIFGQSVSVDTLERINRRMAGDVAEFFDSQPIPVPADEGELLAVSADAR